MKIITQAESVRPRIETLLVAQQRLRAQHPHDRLMEFEVSRAIESLMAGLPDDACLCTERWCTAYLGGAA